MNVTQTIVDKLREKIEWDASKANLLHLLAANHIEQLDRENEQLKNLIIGCAGAVNPEDAVAILKAEVRRIKALREPD